MEAKRQCLGKPNFYRIIMPSVISEDRLVLPGDFVEQYKDQLSDTARLDLPAGPSWSIGLKKYGHLLFLDDGWERLMKHLSIRLGYFLFFKFKGNSRFDLHIFNLTGIEIHYPLSSPIKRSNPRNENAPAKQCLPAAEVEQEKKDESHGLNQPGTSMKNKCQLGKEPGLEQRGEMGLGTTMMNKTENPFFIAKMKRYNLTGSYTLNLPAHFGREIVTDEAGCIEIQDSNENKWQARCIIRESRVGGLGAGWSKFAREKRLQINDECVFELIQTSIIKVSVLCPRKNGSDS